jgi:PIN domain nuclease of toxin-antitoxin system
MKASAIAVPRVLLDTHVWFWLVTGNRQLKSVVVTKLVDAAAKAPLLVSVISAWEIGMLVAKKRLGLNAPVEAWIKDACNQPEFDITGISVPIALDSIHLPGNFHADPADRFLLATARANRAMLVTRDERIIEYASTGHISVMAV